MWVGPNVVEIDVSDRGDGPDDRLAGLRLPTAEPGGLGLWICGRVADRLLCGSDHARLDGAGDLRPALKRRAATVSGRGSRGLASRGWPGRTP